MEILSTLGPLSPPTKYEIAARVGVVGLDGFTGRLTAVQQRRLFGRNIFGMKRITIDASSQGRVFGTFSVCFGTDSSGFELSFDQIVELALKPWMPVRF